MGASENGATRYLLLVNPSAGGGRSAELAGRARAAFDRHGLGHRLVMTRSLEHGCSEAAEAALAGEPVAVMSGDGLIGQVGGVLAGTRVPLAIVPGGRGNDLARALGIPTDIDEAVATIAADHRRTIDVGEVNGQRFLCIASCGFDSDANRIANEARFIKGNLVYAYAALRALAAWKPAGFTVTVDGDRHELEGYSVAVANSQAYGGGMLLAPHAELDDGQLDVVATGRASRVHFLRSLPLVFKGEHLNEPSVSIFRGRRIEVTADRPFDIYADGDPVGSVPATISVLPRCLRVVVPA